MDDVDIQIMLTSAKDNLFSATHAATFAERKELLQRAAEDAQRAADAMRKLMENC